MKILFEGMKILCLITLLNFFSGNPGDFVFKQIAQSEKLPSNSINTIYQDSQGFMWLGSNIGLSKYDGYGVYNFKTNSSDTKALSNYFITDILEDTIPGNLWIATRDGLNYYDCSKNEFSEFCLDDIDKDASVYTDIRSLFWDQQNNLWLGTTNGVVCIDNQQSVSVIFNPHISEGTTTRYISDIEYWKNDLYFVASTNGLYTLNKNDHTYTKIINEEILSLLKDNNENFWFGTRNNGVWCFPANTDKGYGHYTAKNSTLKNGLISSIAEDSLGQIWFSERGNGISIFNPVKKDWIELKSSLYNKDGIKSDVNNKIYIDRQKNVWIGSFDAGIYFLDNNKKAFRLFQFNYSKNGLKNNNIRSMFQDSDGDIWIGTKVDGCLSKFDPSKGTFEHFEHDANNTESLNDGYVLCITELKPGYILAGTLQGGLNVLDKKTGKFKHVTHDPSNTNTVSNSAIYSLLKDSKGRAWIGTGWAGVDVFNENMTKLHSFHHKPEDPSSLLGNRIRSIFEDRGHHIWIGTDAGLNRYNEDSKSFKRFYSFENDTNSLSHSDVSCIYEDTKGRFWVATQGGGLNLVDREKESFVHYTEKDGLASNNIRGMVEDDSGNLWLSTTNGISKFTLSDDVTKIPVPNFRNYDVKDGLQGNEFTINASLKTKNGEILFGGNHGFNIFKPEAVKDNQHKPQVHFVDFKLFNKSVEIGAKDSILKNHINNTQRLTLNHKQSIFSIAYLAINYSSPEKNQYAFKMDGLEDSWNYVGNKREATYTILNPGTYTFMVKASNNDGLWNEESISLEIKVLPPPWMTWWAYLTYFILILALILYLRYNALRKIKEEKEHELNQLKLKFFINISHEFRTPLTLILNPLDKLSSKSDAHIIDKSLKSIKRNASQLLRLVNQLLEHRKTELGMITLNKTNTDVVTFTKNVFNLYEDVAASKNIKLAFKSSMSSLEMMVDKDKYEIILHNLLSNAIKFTKHGTVRIHISKSTSPSKKEIVRLFKKKKLASYVEITVRDTGVGLSKKQINNIFERFYQVDETKPGTGLGLNFVKSLVELHGGEILVESEEHKGSAFILRLPITKLISKNNRTQESDLKIDRHVFSFSEIESLSSDIETLDAYVNELEDNRINKSSVVSKKPLLLIVEDNRELRSQLKDKFNSYFRIQEAKNGEEGWQKTLRYYPDIIISDIVMPVMDGIELCKKVKTSIKTSHIPVILLTAKNLVQNEIEGFKTGADDYISKPFNMQLLFVRVTNLIASRKKMKEKFSSSRIILPAKDFTTNNLDEAFLDNVSDIILKNITNTAFNPLLLAEKLGTSSSNLYKKLNALTGNSPSKFIRDVKLKYAAELLLTKQYSVKEICYKMGFKSPSYFSKTFRELFDQTPLEYIDSHVDNDSGRSEK